MGKKLDSGTFEAAYASVVQLETQQNMNSEEP
jgi:hypothetical protein